MTMNLPLKQSGSKQTRAVRAATSKVMPFLSEKMVFPFTLSLFGKHGNMFLVLQSYYCCFPETETNPSSDCDKPS